MKMHTILDTETENLALLARLSLTKVEHASYKKDIESILSFIDTIQDVSIDSVSLAQVGFAPIGCVREDILTQVQANILAIEIVNQAPNHVNNSVKVKKILAQ